MSYSKTFNPAWAKPKKGQVKKQAEASVTVKPVEVSQNEPPSLETPIERTTPEPQRPAELVVEPQKTDEPSASDNTVSLEAIGIRTIDFAYASPKNATSNKERQQESIESKPTGTVDSASEQSVSADTDRTEAQASSDASESSLPYAKRFSQQWSQPNRSRPEAAQNLEVNAQPYSNDYVPRVAQLRKPAVYDLYSAGDYIPPRPNLRHSELYKRRSKDDADLTTSLDGQTARLLREQFSADEFLAYYRGRRSGENSPPLRRHEPLIRPRDAETIRESRTSASSIGDTPPKYHRVSRGSNHSDRWRRSSSSNNYP